MQRKAIVAALTLGALAAVLAPALSVVPARPPTKVAAHAPAAAAPDPATYLIVPPGMVQGRVLLAASRYLDSRLIPDGGAPSFDVCASPPCPFPHRSGSTGDPSTWTQHVLAIVPQPVQGDGGPSGYMVAFTARQALEWKALVAICSGRMDAGLAGQACQDVAALPALVTTPDPSYLAAWPPWQPLPQPPDPYEDAGLQ